GERHRAAEAGAAAARGRTVRVRARTQDLQPRRDVPDPRHSERRGAPARNASPLPRHAPAVDLVHTVGRAARQARLLRTTPAVAGGSAGAPDHDRDRPLPGAEVAVADDRLEART